MVWWKEEVVVVEEEEDFRNHSKGDTHTVEHRTDTTWTRTVEFRSHNYHREEFRNHSKGEAVEEEEEEEVVVVVVEVEVEEEEEEEVVEVEEEDSVIIRRGIPIVEHRNGGFHIPSGEVPIRSGYPYCG